MTKLALPAPGSSILIGPQPGSFYIDVDPTPGGAVAVDVGAGGQMNTFTTVDKKWRSLFTRGDGGPDVDALKLIRAVGQAPGGTYEISAATVSTLQPARVVWSGATGPNGLANVGDPLRLELLPEGVNANIQVLRDGVAIQGASANGAAGLSYTVVEADRGVVLGATLAANTYFTSGVAVTGDREEPRRYGLRITEAAPSTVEVMHFVGADLRQVPPPMAAYTLGGKVLLPKTMVGIRIDAQSVYLDYSSHFVPGDAPTLAYAPPAQDAVQDVSGNKTPAFGPIAVYSELPLEPVALVLKNTSSYKPVAPNGFVCGTANSLYADIPTLPNIGNAQALMNGDGWAEMQCVDADPARRMLGLTWAQNGYMPWINYGVQLVGGVVQAVANGALVGAPFTFSSLGPACLVRIRRLLEPGRVTFDTSENGVAGPWTTRHAFARPEQRDNLTIMIYTASLTVPIFGVSGQGLTNRGY